jgi:hypothetical protein
VTEKTASNPLTVIATRLPYIDRRSLSQAWFSALHLASDGPIAANASDRRGAAATAIGTSPKASAASTCASDAGTSPLALVTTREASGVGAEIATRRTLDARVAAAARGSFARARSYPPFASTLALAVGNERVQLVFRRDGATLHVVAICRPEIAQTVRRALAAADLHMRVRGESMRSWVKTTTAAVRA